MFRNAEFVSTRGIKCPDKVNFAPIKLACARQFLHFEHIINVKPYVFRKGVKSEALHVFSFAKFAGPAHAPCI